MRSRTLPALLAAAALLIAPAGHSSSQSSREPATAHTVQLVINAFRRTHGLQPLELSRPLAEAARQHSREMGRRGYFRHSSFDGTKFSKRIQRFYARKGRYWEVGENLLWSSRLLTARRVVATWAHSPEHRANLLRRTFRRVGVSVIHVSGAPGVFGGRDVTIVTADFGVRH